MSTRKHTFSEDEYYHIYNRGNSKQDIFLDKQDYGVFQHFLYLMNMKQRVTSRELQGKTYAHSQDAPLVAIGVYCLMPNHFHILLTQKSDKGISKFMQKITTAYTMYFNQKYKRTGALFEGTYKSKHVENDVYLKYLYSYIHLNPLKLTEPIWKELLQAGRSVNPLFAMEYQYSSVQDYLGNKRVESFILSKKDFPEYFSNREEAKKDILSWFIV